MTNARVTQPGQPGQWERPLLAIGWGWQHTVMSSIQRIRPEGLVSSPAFSHVAIVPPNATTIYVGGQNSVDSDGSLVGEGDVGVQAARALTNAKTALASAGQPFATLCSGRFSSWTVPISPQGMVPLHPSSPPTSRPS